MITYERIVTRKQAQIEMTLYALKRQIGDVRKIARDYKQLWQYHMDKTARKRKELEDYKSQLNI